jgi:hypothetical protein
MESTSKRSSKTQTIASAMVVDPSRIQSGASGPSKRTSENENILNRDGCYGRKLAAGKTRRGEINSQLQDIRQRVEPCIENNRMYCEKAERNWEGSQDGHCQCQQRLDRLERLARQAADQQIQLTHMYQRRAEENRTYRVFQREFTPLMTRRRLPKNSRRATTTECGPGTSNLRYIQG